MQELQDNEEGGSPDRVNQSISQRKQATNTTVVVDLGSKQALPPPRYHKTLEGMYFLLFAEHDPGYIPTGIVLLPVCAFT